MINPKTLDDITRRFIEALPEGFDRLPEELRSNIRTAFGAALARADLVTREEFDVQSAVLARTREKLESLEKTVRELERDLQEKDP